MPKGIYKHKPIHRFLLGNKLRLGKKHSEKTKEKMKESNTHYWLAKKRPEISGEKCHLWKDGRSKNKEWRSWISNKRNREKRNAEGSHTFGEWELLKKQYNYICPCCGRKEPEIQLTQDHIIPLSRGGSDNIENIQPLCRKCNSKKHTKIIKYEHKLYLKPKCLRTGRTFI